jgi:ABC-2 type transport system permease protein
MAKLIAALIPVAVLVSAPLIFLIVMAPLTGAIASVGVLAVSLGTGALNLWHQRPGTRAKMRQRGSGALLVTIAEIALGILGGAATGLAAYGSLWSVLLIVLFGGALVLLYEGRSKRD